MQYVEDHFAEQGRIRYTLSDEWLLITRRGVSVNVPLDGLDPDYAIGHLRSPGFYVGLVGLAFAFIALLFGILNELGIREAESGQDAFALAVIAGVISLILLIPSWRKVERAGFRSTMAGVDGVVIARAGPEEDRFHDFVEELARRVRSAQKPADS